MSKHWLEVVNVLAWVIMTATAWIRATAGWSSWPRFDKWFWGISFWFTLLYLGIVVAEIAYKIGKQPE